MTILNVGLEVGAPQREEIVNSGDPRRSSLMCDKNEEKFNVAKADKGGMTSQCVWSIFGEMAEHKHLPRATVRTGHTPSEGLLEGVRREVL